MRKLEYFHNPRCTKSREALAILNEKGITPNIRKYLDDVPSEKELEMVLMKLDMKPEQLLRKGEKLFKEKYKRLNLNDHEWVKVMVENPKLIERPIFIVDNKAVVGRPPERVLDIL